jgi:hypothetical protein
VDLLVSYVPFRRSILALQPRLHLHDAHEFARCSQASAYVTSACVSIRQHTSATVPHYSP